MPAIHTSDPHRALHIALERVVGFNDADLAEFLSAGLPSTKPARRKKAKTKAKASEPHFERPTDTHELTEVDRLNLLAVEAGLFPGFRPTYEQPPKAKPQDGEPATVVRLPVSLIVVESGEARLYSPCDDGGLLTVSLDRMDSESAERVRNCLRSWRDVAVRIRGGWQMPEQPFTEILEAASRIREQVNDDWTAMAPRDVHQLWVQMYRTKAECERTGVRLPPILAKAVWAKENAVDLSTVFRARPGERPNGIDPAEILAELDKAEDWCRAAEAMVRPPKTPAGPNAAVTPSAADQIADHVQAGDDHRRPAYARDHLWLNWYFEIGPNSLNVEGQIRDRWNALPPADRQRYAPMHAAIPKAKPGYDRVRKQLAVAQKERKAEGEF